MTATPLHVRIDLAATRARRWHAGLVQSLLRAGHQVSVRVVRDAPSPPATIDLLVTLERFAHRRRGPHPFERVAVDSIAALGRERADSVPDLVVDLTGRDNADHGLRRLVPLYAGSPREEAAVSALLAGGMPTLGVRDSAAPGHPVVVRAAIEDRHLVSAAMDSLGARQRTLLADAVDRIARGAVLAGAEATVVREGPCWSVLRSMSALGQEVAVALDRLTRAKPHWYIGWRRCDADRLTNTMTIPTGGWTRIPDDRHRFYADPLIVRHGGRHYLFVEEFPYATARGMISYIPFGENGPDGPARPILERDHHLSYPFVFERDGVVWMVPETSSVGRIDLYRAIAFPDRWEYVQTLVDGVEASDATIVDHGGKLWMFATVSGDGASTWDALHVWSARTLLGPWHPHSENPVLMDALGARPAGAFFERDGRLWRPAQDCTTGYGAGLALARVDQLDEAGFRQSIATVLKPNADWPGLSFHTVNWAAGIEVVDGCEPRAKD